MSLQMQKNEKDNRMEGTKLKKNPKGKQKTKLTKNKKKSKK
jgi:hypothetical protein